MAFKDQFKVFKNNWLLIVIVLVILGLFSGIGTLNSLSRVSSVSDSYYGYEGINTFSVSSKNIAPDVEERQKVETASITSEVDRGTFKDKESRMKQIIQDKKGFILNERVNSYGEGKYSYSRGTYQIRVPTTEFSNTLDELKQIGKLISLNQQTTDITGTYVSLQDDLSFQKNKLERFQQLLDKSKSIDDQISLLNYITEQERTIKALENSIYSQEERIDYATISYTLNEEASDYANIKWLSFSALIKTLVDSCKALLYILFAVLPWAIVVGIIWFIVVLSKRKRE